MSEANAIPAPLPFPPERLIAPLFIVPGEGITRSVRSLPGHYHYSVDAVAEKAAQLEMLGVGSALLFGLPDERDPSASSAYGASALVQSAIRAIKIKVPALKLVADVCLCQYNGHGHCGVFQGSALDNDLTLEAIVRLALELAEAGADILMPSGMVDGAVGAIRRALDAQGYPKVKIMSQAVKYASSLYGPFREAAHFAEFPPGHTKESYQLDYANRREALREVTLDIEEGASMVMVKPALGYGDVIKAVAEAVAVPVAAFSTSGEFGMIHAAAPDSRTRLQLALEGATACRRAGAQALVTYFAEEMVKRSKS